MNHAYQLTRIADNDLTKIWHTTRDHWGSRQADKYLTELEACFLELAEHPELGKSRSEIKAGYRSIPKNKHLIFYRHHHARVEIIRVLHQRMEIESHI